MTPAFAVTGITKRQESFVNIASVRQNGRSSSAGEDMSSAPGSGAPVGAE